MGNYTTIYNRKGIKSKLKAAYDKHLSINKEQFINDLGNINTFEDVFEIEHENQNKFRLKTGVLDVNFYTVDFIKEVEKVILTTSIEVIHDKKDFIENEFEEKIKVKYYDVTGCDGIYLAKVPNGIKVGDVFNVHAFNGTKFGCEWIGDLEDSLVNLALSDHFIEYKNKLELEGREIMYSKIFVTKN